MVTLSILNPVLRQLQVCERRIEKGTASTVLLYSTGVSF
jgi:hypothetical protein